MTAHPPPLTLSDLLVPAVRRHRDRPALTFAERTLSYADLDRMSDGLAAGLAQQGVTGGDRVALHLRNGPAYVVADLAILKLGAVKVPLNELMSSSDVCHCLRHAGVRAVLRHTDLPFPTEVPPCVCSVFGIGQGEAEAQALAGWAERSGGFEREAAAAPDDRAIICYTGGTTGAPKGVVHGQSTLALNLLAHVVCGEIRSDEVMLLTTPLPHSAGYHLQACLLMGGHVVLADRFDPDGFARLTERYRATWTFAVPTMIYRLLDSPAATPAALSSLRTIVYGAAPMNRARLEEALERFGPVFLQIYGQTESPNFITTLRKEEHLDGRLLTSCGAAVPFVSVEILQEDGTPARVGDVGEVAVRSTYGLVHYHENPEATAAAIRNGALLTGDLGYLDERGFLHLVDRAKDMIITGGMNVYSVEVERILRALPGVLEAAVVGLPDPDWGERVVAVIVGTSGIDLEELRAGCRAELAGYKVPKQFHLAEELPLTTYGKIDKKALRADLANSFGLKA